MAGSTQDDEEIFAAIDKTLENMIEGGSYLFNYYPDDVMVKASSGIISEESGMFTMGLGTWGITQFTLYPMWARGFLTHGIQSSHGNDVIGNCIQSRGTQAHGV